MTSLTVLLLDSDREAIERLALALSRKLPQAKCLPSSCAREALTTTLRQSPDVIVSSLEMPDMSGNDFARAVRNAHPQRSFPMLIAVSKDIMALANSRRERTFDHFLLKPFDVSVLAELLVRRQTSP